LLPLVIYEQMSSSSPPKVLVVDDEPDVADAYAAQLRGQYDVEVAHGGPAAIETFDQTFDVVLLDRRMPDVSGDEVLDRIRGNGETEVRVAMVTAVDPDFDIIEMPFDDYLVKPVSRAELHEVIDRLLICATYERQLRKFYSLTSKSATLRANKAPEELDDSDEFAELEERRDSLRQELDETVAQFDDEEFAAVFRELHADDQAGFDMPGR
jgi:DNA-binding response OmpR family regulator